MKVEKVEKENEEEGRRMKGKEVFLVERGFTYVSHNTQLVFFSIL